ncbi:uncharacterized protein LOC142559249 [Dermacentor variabilis]|uniref:uncharacterized protein LOC142559249 n=1 Tax=Dermacentor variabilis TaxID=34621 RepID=UPI003F5BF20F
MSAISDPTHFDSSVNFFLMVRVVDIAGKIYVIKQNFNSSLPPKCDFAERAVKINETFFNYTLVEDPKLRKLMYLSATNSCMIFVDDRNSTEETARCQLLLPAAFANWTIPEDCEQVYRENCLGNVNLTVYQPSCQGLPEITVPEFLQMLPKPPAPKQ